MKCLCRVEQSTFFLLQLLFQLGASFLAMFQLIEFFFLLLQIFQDILFCGAIFGTEFLEKCQPIFDFSLFLRVIIAVVERILQDFYRLLHGIGSLRNLT